MRSYKNNTERSFIAITQLPPMVATYITTEHYQNEDMGGCSTIKYFYLDLPQISLYVCFTRAQCGPQERKTTKPHTGIHHSQVSVEGGGQHSVTLKTMGFGSLLQLCNFLGG